MSTLENKKKRSVDLTTECSEPALKKRKTVKFDPMVSIRIVPNILRYRESRIDEDIWWSRSDCDLFKKRIQIQIRLFMIKNQIYASKKFSDQYYPS